MASGGVRLKNSDIGGRGSASAFARLGGGAGQIVGSLGAGTTAQGGNRDRFSATRRGGFSCRAARTGGHVPPGQYRTESGTAVGQICSGTPVRRRVRDDADLGTAGQRAVPRCSGRAELGERPACPRVHVPARSAGIRCLAQTRADPVGAAATGRAADAARASPSCLSPRSHYLGADHARGADRTDASRPRRACGNRASCVRRAAGAGASRDWRTCADPGPGAAGRSAARGTRLGSGGTGVCRYVAGRARRGAGSFAHLRSQARRHAHQDRHAKPYGGSRAAADARGPVPCESGSVCRR